MRTRRTGRGACFGSHLWVGSLESAYGGGVPSSRLPATEKATTRRLLARNGPKLYLSKRAAKLSSVGACGRNSRPPKISTWCLSDVVIIHQNGNSAKT